MMERDFLLYEFSDPDDVEGIRAYFKNLAAKPSGPDATRAEKAALCEEMLAKAGYSDDPLSEAHLAFMSLPESNEARIAALWLTWYRRLNRVREQVLIGSNVPENVKLLTMCAEELGRLQERMWWRAVPEGRTKKSPEALALGKRKQVAAIPKAAQARRQQAEDAEPEWWDDAVIKAKQIREKWPEKSRWRIAGEVAPDGVTRGQVSRVLKKHGID